MRAELEKLLELSKAGDLEAYEAVLETLPAEIKEHPEFKSLTNDEGEDHLWNADNVFGCPPDVRAGIRDLLSSI